MNRRDILWKAYHQARFWDVRRLGDLGDRTVSHSWLWAIDPVKDKQMGEDDFVMAVRVRLGCSLHHAEFECAVCGKQADCQGIHALNCATSEKTRGHNQVVFCCADFVGTVDPAVDVEPKGLCESDPGLRPGDFISAEVFPNCEAAVDVTIRSPEVSHVGGDCVQNGYVEKTRKYERKYTDLQRHGMKYIPMVWSHWGRAHIDVKRIIARVSTIAGQRRGLDPASIARRWKKELGTILALRQARCAARILPRQQARHRWCLDGLMGEEGGTGCASAAWDEFNEDIREAGDDEGPWPY